MRRDRTTPDTRLADDPMKYNPASVTALRELMLGGPRPRAGGAGRFTAGCATSIPCVGARGLPESVAALIDQVTDQRTGVTLVNLSLTREREVIVQAGAYGEHRCGTVEVEGRAHRVDGPVFTVRLGPGAGARLVIHMDRYANRPTLTFPWDRGWRKG